MNKNNKPFSLDAGDTSVSPAIDRPGIGGNIVTVELSLVPTIEAKADIQPRRSIDLRAMHPDKFFVSQSDMKNVIRKGDEIDHCAKQVMEIVIFKNYPKNPPSEPMLAGSYFETLCLGSGAHGQMVLDLPRKFISEKKKRDWIAAGNDINDLVGDKSIDQQRIEIQAERFRIRCEEQGIKLSTNNVQVPIIKEIYEGVYLIGELDIFPVVIQTKDKGKRRAVVDLKLTSNIHSKWGDFCWGAPEYMDHTQASAYTELITDINIDLNPHLKPMLSEFPRLLEQIKNGDFSFFYWIFGYQKEPLHKQEDYIEYVHNAGKRRGFYEAVRKYLGIMHSYSTYTPEKMPVNPKPEHCLDCPLYLANDCTHALTTKTV